MGSHQFQAGFLAAPRNRYDQQTEYVNDGFVLEEQRLINPNNIAAGTVPFHRRYQTPLSLTTRAARDSDVGVYIQDTWRPMGRLTLNLGIRADFVKREDAIFNITRQKSTEIGPRFGFSYLVTEDARNVLRGSAVRVHEQVMGRDAITTFGASEAAGQRDEYDFNGDGIFETVVNQPARTATLADFEFADDLHQPYVDEFIIGFRKQFAGQLSIDIAGISRSYHDNWARVDINGIYPSGPNQAFGGFGLIDPNRGIIFQQQNNSWSTLEYRALEITVAKNLSNNFQMMAGVNRQWQHFGGTWNPTDPAKFIQPDAFPSDALLYMPRGNNEENSLPLNTGTTVHTYGPTWQEYSMRFGGSSQRTVGDQRRGQLHHPGGAVVGTDRRSAPPQRPAARGLRAVTRHAGQRHDAEQPAVHPHAVRERDARRRPGAGAADQDAGPELQQVGALPAES